MLKRKKFENAEFVMSKDELTYAEVLEDFEDASSIHILTYNISKDKSDLLKALKKCDENTEISIISNILGVGKNILENIIKVKQEKIYHYIKVNYHQKKLQKRQKYTFVFQITQKL